MIFGWKYNYVKFAIVFNGMMSDIFYSFDTLRSVFIYSFQALCITLIVQSHSQCW